MRHYVTQSESIMGAHYTELLSQLLKKIVEKHCGKLAKTFFASAPSCAQVDGYTTKNDEIAFKWPPSLFPGFSTVTLLYIAKN